MLLEYHILCLNETKAFSKYKLSVRKVTCYGGKLAHDAPPGLPLKHIETYVRELLGICKSVFANQSGNDSWSCAENSVYESNGMENSDDFYKEGIKKTYNASF